MAKHLNAILKKYSDVISGKLPASKVSALTTGKEPGVDYASKMQDGRDFVALHSVEKIPDRNGNGDDLFNAANIGRSELGRHGHVPKPKDTRVYQKANEEVEDPSIIAKKKQMDNNEPTHEIEFADKPGQKFRALGKDKDDLSYFNKIMGNSGSSVGTVTPLSDMPKFEPITGGPSKVEATPTGASASAGGVTATASADAGKNAYDDDFLSKMGASDASKDAWKQLNPENKSKILDSLNNISKARLEKAKEAAVKHGLNAPASAIDDSKSIADKADKMYQDAKNSMYSSSPASSQTDSDGNKYKTPIYPDDATKDPNEVKNKLKTKTTKDLLKLESTMCENCGESPCTCDADDMPRGKNKKKLLLDKAKKSLQEKSESIAQQKLMGMALAYKRGDMPEASEQVKKLASSMSEKQLKDYAKTKHKGLPQHVQKEESAPASTPITFPVTNSREGFKL